MSNVLARFRGPSEFQLLDDARKLRGGLYNWAENTHNIPKRNRAAHLPALADALKRLVNNIEEAKRHYPKSDEELEIRREYIELAIIAANDIWDELQFIYDTRINNGGINLDSLEPHLDLLVSITNALRKWKRAGKVKPK